MGVIGVVSSYGLLVVAVDVVWHYAIGSSILAVIVLMRSSVYIGSRAVKIVEFVIFF